MPVDVNVILQKLGENERTNGMMNAFQALPREEQIQVLEWSKTMCMRLAAMMEKQKVVENSGRAEPVDLPAPKMFVDTALRIGVVYAMLHQNKDLHDGCRVVYRHVFGDQKMKNLDDLEESIKLTLQMSKW